MTWTTLYEQLNQREREEFARICNRLLESTFLLKQVEGSKRDYYFVERHLPVFEGYLRLMNWDLTLNREHGVVQALNRQGGNRLSLRLMESIILLLLRLIYEERRRELMLTQDVVCTVQDLHDKALSLSVREKGVIEKKHLRDAFVICRRYWLIELIDEEPTAPSCLIKLLPSLLFAVRLEGLQELHERLEAYREGGAEDETADSDSPD